MSKRYERIEFQLHDFSLERMAAFADEWIKPRFSSRDSFSAETKFGTREWGVVFAADVLSLFHIELPANDPVEQWVVEGAKCTRHLFLETEDYATEGDENRGYWFNKQRQWGLYYWFVAYMKGLIIAFLSRNDELIAGLCNWPWATLEPEFSGLSEWEDELQWMFMILTSSLRETAMEGVDDLVEKVDKTRKRRPKLLKQIWEAIVSDDQAAFEKALEKSLKQFKRTLKHETHGKIAERLALPQTAFALAGRYRGLTIPNLPVELSDYLITHESLGLKPDWKWERE